MQDIALLTKVLGIERPWEVKSYYFNTSNKRLDIFLCCSQDVIMSCPKCGSEGNRVYESERDEVFPHLDFFEYRTFIHAKMHRLMCSNCGIVEIHAVEGENDTGNPILDSVGDIGGVFKNLYSIATRPIGEAAKTLEDEFMGLVGWIKSRTNIGGRPEEKHKRVKADVSSIASGIESIFSLNQEKFSSDPKIYNSDGRPLEKPKSTFEIISPAEQLKAILRVKEKEKNKPRTGTDTVRLPRVKKEKIQSNFNVEDWKTQLGIDVENIELTLVFPVLVNDSFLDRFLQAFTNLYNCSLGLIYSNKEKTSSAPLRFDSKKAGEKPNICVITYEGNARAVGEIYKILHAKLSDNPDDFLDLFVKYAEQNLEIDPVVFEQTLRAVEEFIGLANQKVKITKVILNTKFGVLEMSGK